MSQKERQDRTMFIRIQLERAWDAGDLPLAMHMSRLMDRAMVEQLRDGEPEQRKAQ